MPDVKVKYELYRGNTSGIDDTPLKDGQILFDEERQRIALDAVIDGELTRIIMTEKDTFNGTQEAWESLSDEQKEVFTYVNIFDDYEAHSGVFVGATDSKDGQAGLVIQPKSGDQDKYLKGDGTWAVKPIYTYDEVGAIPMTMKGNKQLRITYKSL